MIGEKFSPKEISKRMKAKGLQKLKNYCQMCMKQCRDDNGFKCHIMSEGHLRQMELFGQNPNKFIELYSMEFESTFLDHTKRCHGSSRVAATMVYNEYISDRHHIHMNATKWATLTEFVMYLGRTGKCKVEDTEKGWFITYNNAIDSFGERCKNKRLKSKLVEEENRVKQIEKQIQTATKENLREGEVVSIQGYGNTNTDTNTRVGFAFAPSLIPRQEKLKLGVFEEDASHEMVAKKRLFDAERLSVLDQLMLEEEAAKDKRNRKLYWLCEGIVVKVTNKELADKGYYNKKGVVRKVLDKYYGEIEMLDTTTESDYLVRVHQDDLETVIPCIGGLLRIVNGSYRGFNARLLDVDVHNFCAKVQLDKCVYEGRVLQEVAYEDICKLLV